MNRRAFIKNSSLAGMALAAPVLLSFNLQQLSFDELIGKGHPKLHGDGFKLRKEAYEAFFKMKTEAAKEDINIQVVSSYRNFDHQKRIWSNKYNRFTNQGLSPEKAIEKIIEYSTIPGTSRHHWGTDLDIIDGNVKQPKHVLNAEHFHGDGAFCKLKEWMDKYSEAFGFYLVYTDNVNRKGFKYEPWHYSYKPLSRNFLTDYRKINLFEVLKNEKLVGSEYFSENFIEKYITENILDINPELL